MIAVPQVPCIPGRYVAKTNGSSSWFRDYCNTNKGAYKFYKIFAVSSKWCQEIPQHLPLNAHAISVIADMGKSFGTANTVSILIKGMFTIRTGYNDALTIIGNLWRGEAVDERLIKIKNIAIAIADISIVILFSSSMRIVKISVPLFQRLLLVIKTGNMIEDGVDFRDACFDFSNLFGHGAGPANNNSRLNNLFVKCPQEVTLGVKITNSMVVFMNLIKNTAAVAGTTISLVALLYGTTFAVGSMMSVSILALGTIDLAASFISKGLSSQIPVPVFVPVNG